MIHHLNGAITLPEWGTDADRSYETNPADILRVIDLLNGAGCFAECRWCGTGFPACRSIGWKIGPTGDLAMLPVGAPMVGGSCGPNHMAASALEHLLRPLEVADTEHCGEEGSLRPGAVDVVDVYACFSKP